jgi:hypothetical protein
MSRYPESNSDVQVQTLQAFLDTDHPEKEPLVEGLISRRDLIALGARRRHGKTTLLLQLGLTLPVPGSDFLGYKIPKPRRVMLFLLEDDPRELQDKLRAQLGDDPIPEGVAIYTCPDFQHQKIAINADDSKFQDFVDAVVMQHRPDLIVFDNLAFLVGADYGDSKKLHAFWGFVFGLATKANAAIIVAAHPRKNNGQKPVKLEDGDGGTFFESIMGSSQFINSMGSLWGLERQDDRALFLGGQQRATGEYQRAYLELGDDKRFRVLSDANANLSLLLNTDKRREAWKLLPNAPTAFTFTQGRGIVQPVMSSKDGFVVFMREAVRLNVMEHLRGGQYRKVADRIHRPRMDTRT